MNSIYRREPIRHKLPAGWSGLDAAGNTTINAIKGLQHLDNPLAAEQNSTYSCKNVYQDESGNLTVRPALRCIEELDNSHILGVYSSAAGRIIHKKSGSEYYLTIENGQEIKIGEGNITLQESDDSVYILYTDLTGKLAFSMIKDGNLVAVEPDIPSNNADKPLSRLYNLLSDKTKFETYSPLPVEVTGDMFELGQITRLDSSEQAIQVKILKSGHIIFVYKDKIVIGKNYGGTYSFMDVAIDIPKLSKYYPKAAFIEDDSENSVFKIHTADINGSSVLQEIYTVSLNGSFYKDAIAFELPSAVGASWYAYPGPDGVLLLFWQPSGNNIYNVQVYHKGILKKTFGNLGDANWRVAVSKNSVIISIDSGITHKADTYAYDIKSNKDIVVPKQLIYNVSWGYLELVSEQDDWYAVVETYDDTAQAHTGGVSVYTSKTYTDADGNLQLFAPVDLNPGGEVPRVVGSTREGVILNTQDFYLVGDSILHEYNISELSRYNIEALNKDSTIFVKYVDGGYEIHTRQPVRNYVLAQRPISDNFPVVSDIEDQVLTSFYLDNIYWFVTKHRVFGTGVANEQFSIKYFDPRKYFHFDEELTAAIRISDNSFWVFHHDGAYLIYKSTAQVYDELSGDYIEMITWLCTSTAKSKGCDFENAAMTLPVTSYISAVTSEDISSVQMRENVQTDDRILVPMTLRLRKFVSSLLFSTKSIKTAVYKYNAIFFLNRMQHDSLGGTPVLVYNTTTDSWWYWELPVLEVIQADSIENGVRILAYRRDGIRCIFDFYTDYYDYQLGGLTYQIYADRLYSDNAPEQIDWFWESAILHFGTVDYRKQLLSTNFTFGESDTMSIDFEYNFEVYADGYSDRTWSEVNQVVERAKTYSCKTIIANFAYLQLYLKNKKTEENEFEAYARPKFSAISFKYRVLTGGRL